MGYFNMTYYDSLMHSDTKRDLNGTSVSKEKGTDGKANNTSAYNHDYYIHHKEKWQDNKDSKDSKDSNATSGAATGDDKSGLKEGDFDLDAAALDVIRGKYGNGQARKDALGADYEMIQKRVNEMYKSGKFGGGTGTVSPAATSGDAAAASGDSGSSERSTKWYNGYNNKIADSKAAKAEKELQERAAKEAQEQAQAEAAKKKKK